MRGGLPGRLPVVRALVTFELIVLREAPRRATPPPRVLLVRSLLSPRLPIVSALCVTDTNAGSPSLVEALEVLDSREMREIPLHLPLARHGPGARAAPASRLHEVTLVRRASATPS